MQFKLEGIMDIVAPLDERKDGFLKEKSFSVETVADSENEAKKRACFKLQIEMMVDSPRNFRFKNIQPVSHKELGELGKYAFERIIKKWIYNNRCLEKAGFKLDILAKPELIPAAQGGGLPVIRYIDSDTNEYLRDPQLNFPQKIISLILKVVKNKKEVETVIDLIFERINVKKEMEEDGDHHSMTYGDQVIPVFYIETKEALLLARSPEKLRQLID